MDNPNWDIESACAKYDIGVGGGTEPQFRIKSVAAGTKFQSWEVGCE
jgi:hypothetical protein